MKTSISFQIKDPCGNSTFIDVSNNTKYYMRIGGTPTKEFIYFGTTYYKAICIWLITADTDHSVHLNILNLIVAENGRNHHRSARFRIGDGYDVNDDQYMFITGDYPSTVTSSSNKMWMRQEPEGEQIFEFEFHQVLQPGNVVRLTMSCFH